MSESEVALCASAALEEGGRGHRFAVGSNLVRAGVRLSGFVIRFGGEVYGYLNQCAHVPSELDWEEGRFFESSGLYLMCSTHGAIYEPENGRCVGGPCRGASLRALTVFERDGTVYWRPDDHYFPPPATASAA